MGIFYTIKVISLINQIQLKGFDEASQLGPLFAVLVAIIIALSSVVIFLFKKNDKLNREINQMTINHTIEIVNISDENLKKIVSINDKFIEKLDNIRSEMIKKEDERNKEWRESEKETLLVLNGVNSVLEMSEKMKINDTLQITEKLKEIKELVNDK